MPLAGQGVGTRRPTGCSGLAWTLAPASAFWDGRFTWSQRMERPGPRRSLRSLQLLPEPSSYSPFLGSVTGRLGPAWPGKGRKRLASGRVLSCGPPLWPSLPVTSSFKSAGLFQGLGKTAKKSRGLPPFRADLSSLSCGEKAPSRGLAKPPNCTANTNQSRRAPGWTPTLSEGTLDPAPILFCISRMTDTHVYKGLSRRDSTLSPSPPWRVEGLLLEMIKS